jgi:hypothetical protein
LNFPLTFNLYDEMLPHICAGIAVKSGRSDKGFPITKIRPI